MNKHIAQGKWKEMKGAVKQQWGKLTNDDLDQINGDQDKLVGRLQQAYGKKREQVEKEVSDFFDRLSS